MQLEAAIVGGQCGMQLEAAIVGCSLQLQAAIVIASVFVAARAKKSCHCDSQALVVFSISGMPLLWSQAPPPSTHRCCSAVRRLFAHLASIVQHQRLAALLFAVSIASCPPLAFHDLARSPFSFRSPGPNFDSGIMWWFADECPLARECSSAAFKRAGCWSDKSEDRPALYRSSLC
jgi:hypothetical protein